MRTLIWVSGYLELPLSLLPNYNKFTSSYSKYRSSLRITEVQVSQSGITLASSILCVRKNIQTISIIGNKAMPEIPTYSGLYQRNILPLRSKKQNKTALAHKFRA